MIDKVAQFFQISYESNQILRFSEKARNLWDFINFSLGFFGSYHLFKYYSQDQEENIYSHYPTWKQKAFKIADLLSHFSLILGGLTSRPTLILWKWSAQVLLTPQQLERFFSVQGRIPGDKLHRFLIFISFLCGIPATLKTCYLVYKWMKIHPFSSDKTKDGKEEERIYMPIPVSKTDVLVTIKTVSETAQYLLQTPHKGY